MPNGKKQNPSTDGGTARRGPAEPPKDRTRIQLTAVVSTVVCAAAAHGFLFTNEFFSHDSVSYFVYADWGFPFYTGVGRFFIPLYEACKGGVAAPWLIGLLFTAWMVLSALLVIDLLDIRSPTAVALSCGLLCTNVSLSLTGATYVYCVDEYALALLLAAASAWLFVRGGRASVAGVLPLILSLSIYQPYVTVTAALCLLALLREAAEGRRVSVVIRRGVLCVAGLLVGFALYNSLWTLLRALLRVEQARDVAPLSFSGLLERVLSANQAFFTFLFRSGGVLGPLRPAVHSLLLLLVFWRLLRTLTASRLPAANRILVVALTALIPAALYSAALAMPGEAHDLTAFARELFYFLPLSLSDETARPPRRKLSPERVALCVALSLLLWHHVVYANQCYMKKDLEKNTTMILAGRIIDRIESVPGYVPGQTRVAFAGRLDDNEPLDQTRDAFLDLQSQTGLWHAHAATYNLGRYLTDYLRYPLLWDEKTGVTRSELAKAMPIFPATGSVRMIDGIVVVKLSDEKSG